MLQSSLLPALLRRPSIYFCALLFFCSTLSSLSAELDYTALSITAVTSDGACVDMNRRVLNCSLPATLIIHVSGIPSEPARNVVHFQLIGARGRVFTYGWTKDGCRPAAITVNIRQSEYLHVSLVEGELLNVVAIEPGTTNGSDPFLGVSFIPLTRPALTSIGGCLGEGVATFDCSPHRDWLVLTGRGLSVFEPRYTGEYEYEYEIRIGNHTQQVRGEWGFRLHVLSDVEAVLPLSNSAFYIPHSSHFSRELLSFSLVSTWREQRLKEPIDFATNALSVSFVRVPPPIVSSVTHPSEGCTTFGQQLAVTGCVPQRSFFFLKGHYLALSNVTLTAEAKGRWPCLRSTAHDTSASCTVPLIPGDDGTQAWDVEVTTPSGSVTIPQLVTFTTSPSLLSFTPCRDVGPIRPNMYDHVLLLD
jgi:hypothetical protein